jgi:hypothetical protein
VAGNLVALHRADPTIPLDPELYVASQEVGHSWSDPWKELAGEAAVLRYRRRVRRIVSRLRKELRDELQRVTSRTRRGTALEALLASPSPKISPLGGFIAARNAGRLDLMEALRPTACAQHRACPLYRQACAGLLPAAAYPVQEVLPGWEARTCDERVSQAFSLN